MSTTIKTILVYADRSGACGPFLIKAAAFAAGHDAHLVVLVVGLEPTSAYGGLPEIPFSSYFAEVTAVHEEVHRTSSWADENLSATGVSFDVRGIVVPHGTEGRAVARHARYADLTLVPRLGTDGSWHRIVDAALFESGHPVLLCPPKAALDPLGERVLIGWDARPEAARAVSDALGLISGASDIRAVTVSSRTGAHAHGEDPGTDLVAFLARHGLPVRVDAIPRDNRSVADAILRHAHSMGADLIVSGAYGHSRLSEIIIGGATRDLMRVTDRPLFMAH
ncbi:hypothetical protein DLJ53_04925 [Acuticoccus sediminis]|uniref:UspA domain-containing protein n=1 Tax=Acuticoccus sediminis TaxID=2184697 RepID=A0A8B2NUF1_9HYPH|nr:universal stress protein [Acuticoccus sediminis]RAI03818.1 hypothetical protein DLJ53_04925 [Acuticoccus sediminis]